MNETKETQKLIIKKFGQKGYTLRPQALQELVEIVNQTNQIKVLDKIIDHIAIIISKQSTSIIDLNILNDALNLIKSIEIQDQSNNQMDKLIKLQMQNSIIVLNAFKDFPKVILESQGKIQIIHRCQDEQSIDELMGSANSKISMNLKRFLIVKEKLKKQQEIIFFNENIKQDDYQNKIVLIDVGKVVSSKDYIYTYGIIIEVESSTYQIQDQFSQVKLDISECEPTNGFIIVNLSVIVYGLYKNGLLKVKKIILPKIESKQETINYHGKQVYQNNSFVFQQSKQDFFGAVTKVANYYNKIIQLEKNNQEKRNHTININQQRVLNIFDLQLNKHFKEQNQSTLPVVVLSNFLLQSLAVLDKFDTLMGGLNNPLCFILMGEFTSFSELKDQQEFQELDHGVNYFIKILHKYPNLRQNSYFIFIPSTHDLGVEILPKQGVVFPESIIEKLELNIPYFINASNPCRISILGKQFQFCKNNQFKELRKKAIVQLNANQSLINHYVQTISSQSHISPIQIYTQPIFWNYDDSLLLIQQPDFLIIGDTFCEDFQVDQNVQNTTYISPGNFSKNYSFAVIYPFKTQDNVEISEINN